MVQEASWRWCFRAEGITEILETGLEVEKKWHRHSGNRVIWGSGGRGQSCSRARMQSQVLGSEAKGKISILLFLIESPLASV